jgi:signal transduction histidine kinase/DNA-binding response OmpR family regulator
MVLEICQQQEYQRLVIVNEQQYPIGFFYPSRLIPQLLAANQGDIDNSEYHPYLDAQQPVAALGQGWIEPLETLPAHWSLAEFGLYLSQRKSLDYKVWDWALLDPQGKFLGLLDSSHVLQILTQQSVITSKEKAGDAAATTAHQPHTQQRGIDTVVEILEKLPWPLMLQTASGQVVAQNRAWGQQLGYLSDPKGIVQEVQTILATAKVSAKSDSLQAECTENTATKRDRHATEGHNPSSTYGNCSECPPSVVQMSAEISTVLVGEPGQLEGNILPRSSPIPPIGDSSTAGATLNRCFLDRQPNTCTCVVHVPNGQERIWKFAKIPLDSPHLPTLRSQHFGGSSLVEEIGSISNTSELAADLWLFLANDVTEQQQLCKELAAKNADLIQLGRLKDEFLACISHELKTPLTAVLGLSSLLKDRMLGDLNERQARYAGLIHQSGRHLMSVVNDILDLTRMETGQMELSLGAVNIRAVCDRAIAEVKAMQIDNTKAVRDAQACGTALGNQRFTLSIEPGLDLIVADELRLRQMVVHLLANAFKFTQPGDEIGLLVSRWEGWVAFTVWDTGIGIPEHQQHLIFQKFQQLENPMTRQFEGTGLGLVLTRALARLHGGDVSFLSKEGKGSHFTLLLPPSPPQKGMGTGARTSPPPDWVVNQEHSPSRPAPAKPKIPHTYPNRLVLIVEAVARYIDNLTEQLTGLGYRVVIARSGCEALEKARRLQPTAIFVNPLLPLLSGWDVLTVLKSDPATRHISAIVTGTSADKEQAFARCADGFVTLPVQLQVLQPLLGSLCALQPISGGSKNTYQVESTSTPLRILRLLDDHTAAPTPHPALQNHRVLEADDLDQAELLARVWQLDVVLLDIVLDEPLPYLQKFSQYPCLAVLPLVTCDVATTQAASQVSGLSVFPCLTLARQNTHEQASQEDALLSVLQIAAGTICPPSLLVIDFTLLPDFISESTQESNSHTAKGSEWFQALIQYLHTAGFKAAMGRTWAEVLQQIHHQSVDLLLICWTESSNNPDVLSALSTLAELPETLPPVLVLDRRNSHPAKGRQTKKATAKKNVANSMEVRLSAIATQILPPSLSMEELLDHIHSVLSSES